MNIFNQTFKSIKEKELAYMYIDYSLEYKKYGIENLYQKLENSDNDEDKLLYSLFKYEDKQRVKEHIDKSLSDRRLKDLLIKMSGLIGESIWDIRDIIPLYFVGEDFDLTRIESYDKEFYFKADPAFWFKDMDEFEKKLREILDHFLDSKSSLLSLEKFHDTTYRFLAKFLEYLIDGYKKEAINERMEIVYKSAIKYIALKYQKDENQLQLMIDFEHGYFMMCDFIIFMYDRGQGSPFYRLRELNDKEEKESDNEVEGESENKSTRYLKQWEIDALLDYVYDDEERYLKVHHSEVYEDKEKVSKEIKEALENSGKKVLKALRDYIKVSVKGYEKEIAIVLDEVDKIKELMSEDEIKDTELLYPNDLNILFYAIQNRSFKIVEYLLEHGYDINMRNDYGENALLCTLYFQDVKSINKLMELGIDMSAKDSQGHDLSSTLEDMRKYIDVKYYYEIKELIRGLDV